MSDVPPTITGLTMHEQIGRGGFASVWRATDDALGRSVAIKVLSTRATDDETAMRFERECRALGAVSGHPNIVTVHQVGQTPDGHPYLVMGYEPGGSFGDRIASAPLDWAEAVEVGATVADALAVAHQAEVKHRDVKPDNILVGEFGAPKLADFGIARLAGGNYTKSGSITASIAHAPPEVLHGRSPENTADIYSLCSTIYELITGRPPFFNPADESMVPLIGRISTQPPPRLPPPVPDALNDVLARGMAKNRADRPQSATELAAQLRAITSGSGAAVGSGGAVGASPTRSTWSPPPTPPPGPSIKPLTPTTDEPGPTTGTVPVTTAAPAVASPRRWPWIVTTTGLVALAVIAGAIAWPLITDNSASTESTDSTEVPSDEPTTPPSEDDSDEDTTSSAPPVSVGDVDSLSEILLTGDDLADGPGQTLEDNSVESSDDPDHPLLDYDYCESPDLTEVGAGANRVLKLDVLSISPNDIIASTVAVASSPEAAEAVIDDIIANASTCDSFDGGGLPVTITNATRTGDGAEIGLLISGLGVLDDTPLTVLLTTVDNLVLTLEIVSESPEQDRLWALLSERAVAYTSSAG